MTRRRVLAPTLWSALAALVCASASLASSPPGGIVVEAPQFAAQPPAALYRDRDDAARIGLAGFADARSSAPARRRLAQVAGATTAGHELALRGDLDGAARKYAPAFALAENDAFAERHVRWSYGWSLLALSAPREALAQWQRARALHGGEPFWYGYTVPTALWMSGDTKLAIEYFDAAVRSNPEWGRRSGLRKRTAHWRAHERRVIALVADAWRSTQGR